MHERARLVNRELTDQRVAATSDIRRNNRIALQNLAELPPVDRWPARRSDINSLLGPRRIRHPGRAYTGPQTLGQQSITELPKRRCCIRRDADLDRIICADFR